MTARCWCCRPVPESSLDGINCANHDAPAPWPTEAEQAVIDRFGIFDEEAHIHGAWCHPSADGCPDRPGA